MTHHFRSIKPLKQVKQRVDWCSNLCSSVFGKQGFGIIEVLISSAIIVMVVSATVFLGRMAVRNTVISAERAQAYNLGREGIELVRSLRDTRWINQVVDQWNVDFALDSETVKYYQINRSGATVELLSSTSIEKERVDLTPSGSNRDIFYRLVKVEKIGDDTDMVGGEMIARLANSRVSYNNTLGGEYNTMLTKVSVVVNWSSYGQDRSVEVAEFLSNWKPGL